MSLVTCFVEPVLLAGVTAAGFATLFNVPLKTVPMIAMLGSIGVALKLTLIGQGWSIIGSSLAAACAQGGISLSMAWLYQSPSVVFSLPACLPMVPGVYAYRTMLGLLEFTKADSLDQQLLLEIVNNGLKTAFIFLSLAIGIAGHNILLRGRSLRDVFGFSKKYQASSSEDEP